jgi:predicted glycosyltransferase
MKILVDMVHPKDVNTSKNIIWNLEEKGHTVKIAARDKENTFAKLDDYGFEYEPGKHYKGGLLHKAIGVPKIELWLYRIAKKFNPDVFFGPSGIYTAYVSKLLRKPYITYSDTERDFTFPLMLPFTDVILVPSCFNRNLGSKEVRFNSYIELAYLHPNNFKPDSSIFEKLNLNKKDKYILLRISALDAYHDIGAKGLNFKSSSEILKFIKKLESYGHIFLMSEVKLDKKLEEYMLRIPINDLHSCISFATMYIGDGASMAAEAAILGVPSIYVSNIKRRWGYINELENKYGLLYTFSDRGKALGKASKLLEDKNLENKWQKKREYVLSEKIDTAKYMIEFIEKFMDMKLSK